ncbi:DUF1264 domain-containing protein [Trichoderma austrokoningii]
MKSDAAYNNAPGEVLPGETKILASAASLTQNFKPVKNICAHLIAFHAYADDPKRAVEANHYCSKIGSPCLVYDSPEPDARIIGIEYMITPRLYESLPQEERRLWHSHVYEVKSGMLIMPNRVVPQTAWELAEKREMEQIITLYGKTYHFWQIDRGDKLPLGEPKLMTSYVADGQLDFAKVEDRDERFQSNYKLKKEARKDIPSPRILKEADWAWGSEK